MLKRGFSLIAILLLALVVTGCDDSKNEQLEKQDCDPVYFLIKEKSANSSVENETTAHKILISINPGLSNTSKTYISYRNSTVSDVKYGSVILSDKRNINAYTLKNLIAIDKEGNVYQKIKPCG